MDIQVGDRVVVVKGLYGIYNGKKGVVHKILDEGSSVEVILDINRGRIDEITRLPIESIEKEVPIANLVSSATDKLIKEVNREDIVSIDDRIDYLENILNKYDLSVKDNCGFMYVYDFLDELSNRWQNIDKSDKEEICFCILGEKI